jgi:hypothetical protein
VEKTAKRSNRMPFAARLDAVLGNSLWKPHELDGNSSKFLLRITLWPVDTAATYPWADRYRRVRPTVFLPSTSHNRDSERR